MYGGQDAVRVPRRGAVSVRAAAPADRKVIAALLTASWGGTVVVGHPTVYDAVELPALLAERDGEVVGLLTYSLTEDGLEVVTIDAAVPQAGVGSALRAPGAGRMWLVTTNPRRADPRNAPVIRCLGAAAPRRAAASAASRSCPAPCR